MGRKSQPRKHLRPAMAGVAGPGDWATTDGLNQTSRISVPVEWIAGTPRWWRCRLTIGA